MFSELVAARSGRQHGPVSLKARFSYSTSTADEMTRTEAFLSPGHAPRESEAELVIVRVPPEISINTHSTASIALAAAGVALLVTAHLAVRPQNSAVGVLVSTVTLIAVLISWAWATAAKDRRKSLRVRARHQGLEFPGSLAARRTIAFTPIVLAAGMVGVWLAPIGGVLARTAITIVLTVTLCSVLVTVAAHSTRLLQPHSIELTETSATFNDHRGTFSAAWTDMDRVELANGYVVIPHTHGWRRIFTQEWRSDPELVVEILNHYVEDPRARHELTQASAINRLRAWSWRRTF